jgi:hypothetical protein
MLLGTSTVMRAFSLRHGNIYFYPNRGILRPGDFRLFARSRKNMKAVNADKEYLPAVRKSKVKSSGAYQVITYDRWELRSSTVGGRPTGMPFDIRVLASPACPSFSNSEYMKFRIN